MSRQRIPMTVAFVIGVALIVSYLSSPSRIDELRASASDAPNLRLDTQHLTPVPTTVEPDAVSRSLNSLASVLDAEIAERRVMAEQLAEMRLQLDTLNAQLGNRPPETDHRVNDDLDAALLAASVPAMSPTQRMVAAGFTVQQIQSLRRREAEIQMKRISLDDRARRENWVDTPRYFEEFRKLGDSTRPIRLELGDDGYDRYLFAIGRPNRLRIEHVIDTSPAQQAGLHAGDMIVSYGGERVFATQELVRLRSEGDKDEPVNVGILRDGVPMEITMLRGPLGVQTYEELVDPTVLPGDK